MSSEQAARDAIERAVDVFVGECADAHRLLDQDRLPAERVAQLQRIQGQLRELREKAKSGHAQEAEHAAIFLRRELWRDGGKHR